MWADPRSGAGRRRRDRLRGRPRPVSALTLRPAEDLRPSQRLPALLPGIYRQRDAAIALDARRAPLRRRCTRSRAWSGPPSTTCTTRSPGCGTITSSSGPRPAALPLLAELFGVRLLSAAPDAQRPLIARIVAGAAARGRCSRSKTSCPRPAPGTPRSTKASGRSWPSLDFAHLAPWRGRIRDPVGSDRALRSPDPPRVERDPPPRPQAAARPAPGAAARGERLDATLARLGRVDAGDAGGFAAHPRPAGMGPAGCGPGASHAPGAGRARGRRAATRSATCRTASVGAGSIRRTATHRWSGYAPARPGPGRWPDRSPRARR